MNYRISEEDSRIKDLDIARFYLEGFWVREISEKVGLCEATVRKRIVRMQRTGLPVMSRTDRSAVHYEVWLERKAVHPGEDIFARAEFDKIDAAIKAFPKTFRNREDFIRFAVMSALNGSVHDSLVAEQHIMLTARERPLSTPAAAIGDERGSGKSLLPTPDAGCGDDEP
jgi:hypothetical protein